MVKKEAIDFLKKTPPFDMLGQEVLEDLAEEVSLEFYPRGLKILSQNGPPCTSLRIIKKGGVKVFVMNKEGDEVIIDYRSEGDAFGFISLISGDKSRANILALEDTICYLIPKDPLMKLLNQQPLLGEYFMKSFFVNFIDKTYKEMRNRSLVFGEGDKLLYTTPIKDLVSKSAVTAPVSITIKEASVIMSKHKISSLIFVDEEDVPVGIITDRDLRDKVVSRDLDISRPVEEIMSPPLIRVDSHETCFEALVKMIKFNIHHLLVVEEGKLKGVVTNHDFMLLQGTSPLSLVKDIEGQKRVEGLLSIHEKINRIISILFKEGAKAGHITRIITELNDRLLQKIIELSLKQSGPAPAPFVFVLFGSEGRKEQTFKTVFDCALVYDDPKISVHKEEMADYSQKLLANLQDVFKRCGLPMFDPYPLSNGISISGGVSEWEERIINAVASKNKDDIATAGKFLDLRPIYGDSDIAQTLKNHLYKRIKGSRKYLSILREWATKQRSPLGFFKQFVVERDGEHKDKLNIKENGLMPIVDSLRLLAIAHDIYDTPTMDRLDALVGKSDVLEELSDDIASSFEFLMHLRIQDQLRKKEFLEEIDDFIEPEKLSLLEKRTLKEAFRIIPRLQNVVEDFFEKEGAMVS